ncbi:WxcM-like domain-containing protein [Curvibacter gracilis]|uniref:WxcM-like domain-containing protein n=1 Tax=Curvibacter gracilis TaxID=230310 RepID=UPI0005BB6EFB|nr:WxcM-like domain-containing protein [Curvibacter gracilis]
MPTIHSTADVQSLKIGSRTRIWQYVVVLPGAVMGEDCNICSHCFIENDVELGHRVTVKSGVQLWDGLRVADDVFIGPNASFSNDKFPRSRQQPEKFLKTIIEKGASIGAGASILPGIVIGQGAMVGAGAVVTKSVPPNAIVMGNPARITGYSNAQTPVRDGVEQVLSAPLFSDSDPKEKPASYSLTVRGVTMHHLRLVKDMRGDLSVGDFESQIPFAPKRYFLVFNVPSEKTRGEHAHRECHQFLICVRGRCSVMVDDGQQRMEVMLDNPAAGLYLPPMVWGTQYKYSQDAILLVFASHSYDPADYVRDYTEFMALTSLTSTR